MEKLYDVVELEDGIDYIAVDKFKFNNNEYWYLVNENDKSDFCFRKLKKNDNEDVLVGLDDEAEFKAVIEEFAKRNIEYLN